MQTIADHTRGFIKRVASALLGVVLGVLVGNLPQKLAAKFKEVVKGIRDLVRKLIKSLLQKLKKIFGRKGAEGQTDPEGEAPACVHITVRNSGTPQRPGRRESCFPAGTRLDDGRDGLPIESVQRGQRIPAFDQRTGQWRTDAVAETFQREYTGPMVTLRLPGETLRATARHPFWVVRGAGLDERPVTEELGTDNAPGARPGRWVEAQHLRPGDVLAGRRGEVAVEGVSVGEESLTVYNLHVAECRTYAVGECGVVVHNESPQAVDACCELECPATRDQTALNAALPTNPFPVRADAHHILPVEAFDSDVGRRMCEEFCIDLNSAKNGVRLPYCHYDGRKASIHRGRTNRRTYTDVVVERLRPARTRAQALDILKIIRKELCNGDLKINHADEDKRCT